MARWRKYARKAVNAVLATAVLAGLLFVAVPRASARDDKGDCRRRTEKAEMRLDQAIRQHGINSRQAEKRRRELRAERQRCWSRARSWWDSRGQTWRNDQDWDRDDRDRH